MKQNLERVKDSLNNIDAKRNINQTKQRIQIK